MAVRPSYKLRKDKTMRATIMPTAREVRIDNVPDAADRSAGANHAHRRVHGLFGADAFQHRLNAEAAREIADPRNALLAAFADHVGRAELPCEIEPVLVPAHDDDLLGAEPLGGEHSADADRAVADDGHCAAATDPRG